MKLHQLRNATFVIETGHHAILVDPMLGEKGVLPPFSWFRHTKRRNPTVSLPVNSEQVLERVTHCLITHSQTFGLRALQHTDHLDGAGEEFLKSGNVPVACHIKDRRYLGKLGLNVQTSPDYWQQEPYLGGTMILVPAEHGHGWNHHLMANGTGFFLSLPGEPSIYISGDTILTGEVGRALTELRPDISVVAAGGASLDVGPPILMSMSEVVGFVKKAPGRVVANHLEALNHCPTTRPALKQALQQENLLERTAIPEDGEVLEFSPG